MGDQQPAPGLVEVVDHVAKRTLDEHHHETVFERLSHADPMVVVVSADMAVESAVTGLLSMNERRPGALRLEDHRSRPFALKLDIADSQALLDEDLLRAIRKLHSLRNGLAHSIAATVEPAHAQDLLNVIRQSSAMRDTLEKIDRMTNRGPLPFPANLQTACVVIWLHAIRPLIALRQTNAAKAFGVLQMKWDSISAELKNVDDEIEAMRREAGLDTK